MDCNKDISLLKDISIFGSLSPEEIESVCSDCDTISIKAHETLIREGASNSDIFIILKGKLQVFVGPQENPVILAEFNPGECVGETSVIGIQEHSATVVTLEDSTFLVLSRKALLDIFHTNPKLFSRLILNIAREIARRFRNTSQILLQKCRPS